MSAHTDAAPTPDGRRRSRRGTWQRRRQQRSDQAASGADHHLPHRTGAGLTADADAVLGSGDAAARASSGAGPKPNFKPRSSFPTRKRSPLGRSRAPTVVASADLAEVKTAGRADFSVTPIPPAPAAARVMAAAKAEPDEIDPTDNRTAPVRPPITARRFRMRPPARAHGGWLIQIGAFDDENQAKQHLSAAQHQAAQRAGCGRPLHRAGPEGRQGALSRPFCRLRQDHRGSRLQAAQAQRLPMHGGEGLDVQPPRSSALR